MRWMLGIRRFMLVSLSVVVIQSGITTGQQQQQPNNAGFVHPIATDTFPVNRPSAGAAEAAAPAEQPAEETPTSTEPVQTSTPVKQQPMFQVPVTLPFVMQRPQTPNGKPTSYLRPVGVMVDPISQNEPVQQQPVRQTKPWYANLPQEQDLSSAPGVAVTLPFRTKPASYLRPVFVVDEINNDQPAVEDVQPAIQTRPYYFPTRNVAVTLPFNLRPSEPKIPVRSKPLSYLRPVIVSADADGAVVAAGTPEGDDYYYYAPDEEDFTSPISGAVQPSPPSQAVMAIPFVRQPVKATKPSGSYLRPWFVDDSYATPVRATKPLRPQEAVASPAIATQVDDDSAGYNQRPVSWIAYRASPAAMMAPHSVRPLVHRRPIVSFTLF